MMTEIAKNTLEVGTNGAGEVVVNHPDLQPDENGVGHIVFSPEQARALAFLLQQKARSAEEEIIEKRRKEAETIPVDRSAQILTDMPKPHTMWILERIEDDSLIFCEGSPALSKEKILKLAGQRARDNGFNYRVIPVEVKRVNQ